VKAALSRLALEVKERSKGADYSGDYFISTLRALSRLKGTAHAEVRMQCVKDCLLYFYATGRLKEALEASDQLRNLASVSASRPWTRVADTFAGILSADMGDVAEAVVHYSRALAEAISLEDLDAQISVLVNLGSALNYGGLYREAIPCFLKAVSICRVGQASHLPFKAAALSNLSQSSLALGDIKSAYASISEAISLSPEPESTVECYNRTVREFAFVRIALESNEVRSAQFRLQQCRKYSLRCGSARAKFLADIADGLCEIRVGVVERGLSLVENALNSAVTDLGPYRAEALKALVKAYDEVGRPEQALDCLRELLSYIRAVREKGILALLAQATYPLPENLPVEFGDLQLLTHKEAELRAQVAERQLVNSQVEMLERLAITADLKDESSGQHGYRVGTLCRLLALQLNFPRDVCFKIELAARLHDVGKIGVPDRILLSSKTLAEAERQFVSAHTLIGSEILSKGTVPQLAMAQDVARFHHEWWDGTGYPTRISGRRIPIHARIVALADVFDALTHGRPFSEPWPIEKAIEEVRRRSGSQFDPDITQVFVDLITSLQAEHGDLDNYLGKAGVTSPFLQARENIRKMIAQAKQNEDASSVHPEEKCI
jgi:putative two-component system response regulator